MARPSILRNNSSDTKEAPPRHVVNVAGNSFDRSAHIAAKSALNRGFSTEENESLVTLSARPQGSPKIAKSASEIMCNRRVFTAAAVELAKEEKAAALLSPISCSPPGGLTLEANQATVGRERRTFYELGGVDDDDTNHRDATTVATVERNASSASSSSTSNKRTPLSEVFPTATIGGGAAEIVNRNVDLSDANAKTAIAVANEPTAVSSQSNQRDDESTSGGSSGGGGCELGCSLSRQFQQKALQLVALVFHTASSITRST